MATEKEKLEEALEKQQDAAAKRSKEQSSRHKADTVAKDKVRTYILTSSLLFLTMVVVFRS